MDENLQLQQAFLHNFNLFNGSVPPPSSKSPTKRTKVQQQQPESPEAKLRRLPRRSRTVLMLSKCPSIAVSSPAGKQLIKTSKATMSTEYVMERLDRSERFCHAPTMGNTGLRPKFLDKKFNYSNISYNFKRPPGYHYNYYNYPRRQYSDRQRQQAFLWLNAAQLRQCIPVSVSTKRLTSADIESVRVRLAASRRHRTNEYNAFGVPKSKLTTVVDIIDLCSSDEEIEDVNHHFYDADSNRFDDQYAILPHSHADCGFSDPNGSSSSHSSRDGSLSQMAATPNSSIALPGLLQPNSMPPAAPQTPTQPLQPSVLIFSNLTQTSLAPTNRKYKYKNQENSFIILNGVKCSSSILPESATQPAAITSTTTTTATVVAATTNHNNNNHLSSSNTKLMDLLAPDVVIERLQPQQQIPIDLT